MRSVLTLPIDDEDLAALARAATEEGVDIGELGRLILKAALAVYRVENADGAPCGPMSVATRPKHWRARRWRVAHEILDDALAAVPAPYALGDPPPGRSALDAKRAADTQALPATERTS